MNWNDTEQLIRQRVPKGTDVNSSRSKHRVVTGVDKLGFTVRIGQTTSIQIPWTMLRECFTALISATGYDGGFFRARFPKQAKAHPCHVHTVGQMFVTAGLATERGRSYFLRK